MIIVMFYTTTSVFSGISSPLYLTQLQLTNGEFQRYIFFTWIRKVLIEALEAFLQKFCVLKNYPKEKL